ncbi:MAG: DnaJ domain-containing protein [Deltaproteobacteria bacterium]
MEDTSGDSKKKKREAIVAEIMNFKIGGKNYYETLGVGTKASNDDIKTSYFALVKRFHPDAAPDLPKEAKDKTQQIFEEISAAYQFLMDDAKRREYDSGVEIAELKKQTKSVYVAEFAFREGQTLLNRRDYAEAERKFREAVRLKPDEQAYAGALAWTVFLLASDKKTAAAEALKNLEASIAANPKIARNYYYLGCVYKRLENRYRSKANFTKALEYEPDFIEAKRELRAIEQGEAQYGGKKKTGFWSRLFSK